MKWNDMFEMSTREVLDLVANHISALYLAHTKILEFQRKMGI